MGSKTKRIKNKYIKSQCDHILRGYKMRYRTVRLSETTFNRLTNDAKYSETMDSIINSLLDKVDKYTKSQQNTGPKK